MHTYCSVVMKVILTQAMPPHAPTGYNILLLTCMVLSVVPQYSDMNEEMRMEAMELCVTACEKHASNNEVGISCTTVQWAGACQS